MATAPKVSTYKRKKRPQRRKKPTHLRHRKSVGPKSGLVNSRSK